MNKARIEAFTDAVIAIIITIMVLEIKIPESFELSAIFSEIPYFLAYAVSWFFILVTWYNHNYMFGLATHIRKSTFWFNNLWLFVMSMIPVATGWFGRFMNHRAPAYFFLLVLFFWNVTYHALAKNLARQNPDVATKINKMLATRFTALWQGNLPLVGEAIIVYFFPPVILIVTAIEFTIMAILTPKESDHWYHEQ